MSKLKANLKYIILAVIVIAVLAALFLLVLGKRGRASGSTEGGGRSNYMEVKSVPGVKFEVSKDLSEYATAVMEVSKDIDFVKNASYSYCNGDDTYMLFNMSQYIVIVCKGTNFALDQTSVEDALKNNSLNGIWFTKKGGMSSNGGKWVIDVTAQVVITNQIYNDFTGKLAVVKNGDTEWSMFAGSVNANDATLADMAKYTASTFAYYSGTENASNVVYEIDTEALGDPKLVAKEEQTPEPTVQPTVQPTIEPSQDPTEDASQAQDPKETTEPVQTQSPDETQEPSGDPSEESTEAPEETQEPDEKQEDVTTLIAKRNQKTIAYLDDKAYTSTVYNMLTAGQIGYASAINQNSGEYDEIFVRFTSYNDEATTKALIAAHVNSGKAYYTKMDAPLGTHWESITYDVKHDPDNDHYLNVQMVGLDGEKLKYRGIAYGKRSYDIPDAVTKSGEWKTGYVAFFAVPNGCSDYAVALGDANEKFGFKAYYRINNNTDGGNEDEGNEEEGSEDGAMDQE